MRRSAVAAVVVLTATAGVVSACSADHRTASNGWHHNIIATTFWVGELFSAAPDGSQVFSTFDAHWKNRYGGCDGVVVGHSCRTEPRTAANDYFPVHMTPRENPFYLDLPFDDVNNESAFRSRCRVIPWAHDAGARACSDRSRSFMKNAWVEIIGPHGQTCFGQVEDAGPGQYDDHAYVFGTARPTNRAFNGAGMDVSPALNGCLRFAELNGQNDSVSWRFVARGQVPEGPWTVLVTTSRVNEN